MTKTKPGTGARRKVPDRLKKLVLNAALLAVSTMLGLAALEGVLRLFPGWLAPRLGELGTYVYSGYGTRPGDIYFFESASGMRFMYPDFRSTLYWNGHFWKHETDAHGFRNPPGVRDTSLLLLGDSLIYGHGVDEPDTVAAILRDRHGREAFNMGRQGDSLFQHYVLLRLYLDRFQPREVVLFVFINDFHDLTIFRSPEELRDPPEIGRYRYDRIAERVEELGRRRFGWRTVFGRSRAVRLLAGAARSAGVARAAAAPAVIARPKAPRRAGRLPPFVETILDPRLLAPVLDYYRLVLPDLVRRCREHDVRLSLVFLDLRNPGDHNLAKANLRVHHFLNKISERLDLPYRRARSIFGRCRHCFLPNDGHFTREGHRRLADFLDREVLAPKPGETPERSAQPPS